MMGRTITEILKEADKTKDLQTLVNIWNEIANNKYEYTLAQLHFSSEHIRELALKSDAADIEKGKFYMYLKSQDEPIN